MNENNQSGPDCGRGRSQPCRIRRAVALMEANFAAKLSREEMAHVAGLSVSHFSKLFTRCIGFSPHQYLLRCRLDHARKLLVTLEASLSLVDVAGEAGFADQAHFSRHFRRAYGVSPLAFRRAARSESKNAGKAANLKNRILSTCLSSKLQRPPAQDDGISEALARAKFPSMSNISFSLAETVKRQPGFEV
jgi:AraC-like DNA-binding protein